MGAYLKGLFPGSHQFNDLQHRLSMKFNCNMMYHSHVHKYKSFIYNMIVPAPCHAGGAQLLRIRGLIT